MPGGVADQFADTLAAAGARVSRTLFMTVLNALVSVQDKGQGGTNG